MNKMISIILATSYILGNNLENSSTLLKFNTQNIQEIGGSKSVNDIQCNLNDFRNIGIEVKPLRE